MKMHTDHTDPLVAFQRESCFTLDYSRDRILHCLDQLDHENLWWRPNESMNAVGNIVLHVCGNLRQWIVAGLGGAADVRDRRGEFTQRDPVPAEQLKQRLCETVDEAKAVIQSTEPDAWLRSRFIQITDCTGAGAVYHSVAHLEGHAQEIIYITRLRLGERYRFKDVY